MQGLIFIGMGVHGGGVGNTLVQGYCSWGCFCAGMLFLAVAFRYLMQAPEPRLVKFPLSEAPRD